MIERPISELFCMIMDWAISNGADRVDLLPGLWTGETADWLVELNGHETEVEDIPPFTFKLTHKVYFLGIALISPFGGALVGASEGELIEHFKGQGEVAP